MIQLVSTNGSNVYGVYKYIVDLEEDLINIPAYVKMGSEAFVSSLGKTYIKNSSGNWIFKPDSTITGEEENNVGPIPDFTLNEILNEIFNKEGENL